MRGDVANFWLFSAPEDNDAMNPQTQHATDDCCPENAREARCRWAELLGTVGGVLLAWEWQEPELLAQHFLTVAFLQLATPGAVHRRRHRQPAQLFIAHLDQGLAVAEIRLRVAQRAAGTVRVLKPENERRPMLRHWAMTIADVCIPDQPGRGQRVTGLGSQHSHRVDGACNFHPQTERRRHPRHASPGEALTINAQNPCLYSRLVKQ